MSTRQPANQELRIVPYSQNQTNLQRKKIPSRFQVPSNDLPISCLEIIRVLFQKRMILLLKHGTIPPREEDGAIEFRRFEGGSHVKVSKFCMLVRKDLGDHFETGRGKKKRFQFCTNYTGSPIRYLRAIQGHVRDNPVDPSSLEIPCGFFEFVHHVAIHLSSQPWNPMDKNWVDQEKYDDTTQTNCANLENKPRRNVLG